ncbi:DNA-binding transcriptional regulator, IclR family [Halopenitus malekzadehii]|uniref:DNA-binding transcriptional regulator, IclR family n=1 Tax=Halopenitus malekzadehii TaxID=1267564 RepID=A0A1H6I4L2_9EURY|nr:IclR family transcriptional regulator [Halopenitus malekzadehii]SEH41336.1 DNA-binding transcriptional regulator, IclR family [Halopenitus malekzadehii]
MGNQSRKTSKTSLEAIEAIRDLEGATLSEIADHTDVPVSTLHTHLQTLREMEYVIRDDGTYRLGMKLFHLGERARWRDERYHIVKEHAWNLSNRVGEEVSFAIRENDRMVILLDETTVPSEDGFQVGRYFDLHSSACGKATLAKLSESWVDDYVDRHGLPAYTDTTITDREALHDELETIRNRGYAVNEQEELEGLRAVALAIEEPDGGVFGTLDISGPPYRLPEADVVAERLRSAVTEIEAALEEYTRS